jgi:hypothetical protein
VCRHTRDFESRSATRKSQTTGRLTNIDIKPSSTDSNRPLDPRHVVRLEQLLQERGTTFQEQGDDHRQRTSIRYFQDRTFLVCTRVCKSYSQPRSTGSVQASLTRFFSLVFPPKGSPDRYTERKQQDVQGCHCPGRYDVPSVSLARATGFAGLNFDR